MSRSRRTFTTARVFTLLVVAAVLSGGYWLYRGRNNAELISYREVPVKRGDLEVTVLSPGVVEPENRLDIKPPVAGRVEDVLVKEGEEVKKGQILAWMSSTERAALLDAARARGAAEVRRWEDFYRPTPVIAPIDGTIILRSVEPGQTFTSQEAVLVMSDRLTIKAQVDETDVALVQLKQLARVTLDAYPEETFSAQVVQIAYDAQTVNNVTTYQVDVLPDSTPSFMRSGMTANVTFVVANKKDVVLAPSEALHTKDEQIYVLTKPVKGKDPREAVIQLGLTDGKQAEVLSGVVAGEVLLIPQIKTETARKSSPFTPFGARKDRSSK